MKRVLTFVIICLMLAATLTGCGSKDQNDFLEKIDSHYDSQTKSAVIEYKNVSKKTITEISGVINSGTLNNEQLGKVSFIWNGNCEPGETIRIEKQIILSKEPDYLGVYIGSINDGELYSTMF